MGEERYKISIFAPLSGKVMDLEQVPDPVYSERMMGDGVAIMPEDGTMFSPVSGYVTVVAEDKHAFGFTTDDGLEILVHMGVDAGFQPDCCALHIKVNDRVQAGDMIAEFNLEKLKEKGINPITPIIICGGLDGKKIEPASGDIKAGSGAVMTVIDVAAMERAQAESQEKEQKPEASAKAESVKVEPVKTANPIAKQQAAPAAESDVMAFLRDKRNWPKLIGGFVGLTAFFVVIFVGIAMFIGH